MCQASADENTAIYYTSTTDFSCMVVYKWPISTSYIEVRTVFSLYVAQEKRSMKENDVSSLSTKSKLVTWHVGVNVFQLSKLPLYCETQQ